MTGYPWQPGQPLRAEDLNAEIGVVRAQTEAAALSAQGADAAKTAAQTARDQAAAAKTGAEVARDEAVTAASSASGAAGSATSAAASATAAGQAKTDADVARAGAETARQGADDAAHEAGTYQAASALDRQAAQSSATVANNASLVSLANAANAVDAAGIAVSAGDAATAAATTAQTKATEAASSASSAASASSSAQISSDSAQQAATNISATTAAATMALDLSPTVIALPEDYYADVTTDALDRALSGHRSADGYFEAQRLAAIQKVDFALATGQATDHPGLSNWTYAEVDATGRPVLVRTTDFREYQARAGVLVEVDTATSLKPSVTEALAAGVYEEPGVEDWDEAVLDASGRPVKVTRRDGTKLEAQNGTLVVVYSPNKQTTSSPAYSTDWNTGTTWPSASLLADPDVVFGCGSEGQSFVHEGGDTGTPFSTAALHPGFALMPAAGPRPDGGAVVPPVDLREVAPYETVCSGMADVIMTRLQQRLGFKPRIVFFAHSLGGTNYSAIGQNANAGIKRGTVRYNEGLRIVRELTEYYRGLGKRFVVLWHYRLHGENDSSNPAIKEWTYRRFLTQSEMDWQEDVEAITGQRTIIRRLVQQHIYGTLTLGGPRDVAQAQLNVQMDSIRQRCVGASPAISVAPIDDLHPIPRSKADMGRQAGHYAIQDLAGPGEDCMRVVSAWWISDTLIGLEYTHPLALETDDSKVVISTLPAGKGVEFTDGSGTPPTVTGIAISGTDTRVLEVTLSGPAVGKRPRLHISYRNTSGGSTGRVTGPRSAIRRADPIVTATAYYDSDVYAWAVSQTVDL